MCGFIRRVTDSPAVKELVSALGIEGIDQPAGDFRPGSTITGLIVEEDGAIQAVDAKWWFLLDRHNGYKPRYSATVFNARNLASQLWEGPIKTHRGIVLADAIGESNPVEGSKKTQQYLMTAQQGLIVGTLYKKWNTGIGTIVSTAIITRPPIPGFSDYHKKSVPCFLPKDPDFLRIWLASDIESDPQIDDLLKNPRIYSALQVDQVRTYASGEVLERHGTLPKTTLVNTIQT